MKLNFDEFYEKNMNIKIKKLRLEGASELLIKKKSDDRGWFARFFCQEELFAVNKGKDIQQINSSFSEKKGTTRGMHYQNKPYQEDKIVSCLQGKVYDVIVDIRPNSNTFGQWTSTILSSEKMNAVYIPKGFAHGYQTLCNNCQMLYLHTEVYNQNSESGFRHTSPYLDIKWPLKTTNISIKDSELKNFSGKKNDL